MKKANRKPTGLHSAVFFEKKKLHTLFLEKNTFYDLECGPTCVYFTSTQHREAYAVLLTMKQGVIHADSQYFHYTFLPENSN